MKTVLQRLAELGKTILYCTHILEVAETLCPRIMSINAGKLIADAPVEDLRQETNQTALNEIFAQLTETTGIDEKPRKPSDCDGGHRRCLRKLRKCSVPPRPNIGIF